MSLFFRYMLALNRYKLEAEIQEDFLMNSMYSALSFLPLKSPSLLASSFHHSPSLCSLSYNCNSYFHRQYSQSIHFPFISHNFSHPRRSSIRASITSDEGIDSVVQFEDIVERDWSFLDTDHTDSDEEHQRKIDRIISAGNIVGTSKVLVSIGSEAFVDRVAETSPCEQLLIVHDSLLTLACIKEKYDKVKCWQGELINVPDKWTPFDVVFLYFLPGMPFELNEIVGALAKRCSPGARLVISHPQGRQVVEGQRLKYSDVVVSDLPEKVMLQSTCVEHSFEVIEFVDEPEIYLAVLQFNPKTDI